MWLLQKLQYIRSRALPHHHLQLNGIILALGNGLARKILRAYGAACYLYVQYIRNFRCAKIKRGNAVYTRGSSQV